jgi:hypothetical protein
MKTFQIYLKLSWNIIHISQKLQISYGNSVGYIWQLLLSNTFSPHGFSSSDDNNGGGDDKNDDDDDDSSSRNY